MLGVRHAYYGVKDKKAKVEELMTLFGVESDEVLFMGDDLPDLEAMKMVGWPVTVPSAAEKVREVARYITSAKAGEGAVREVVEMILGSSQESLRPTD